MPAPRVAHLDVAAREVLAPPTIDELRRLLVAEQLLRVPRLHPRIEHDRRVVARVRPDELDARRVQVRGPAVEASALLVLVSLPTLEVMDWQERITTNPDVRSGKPCIRGTRITVYDILEYLAGGMTEEQILADFPSLAREDIRAALSFAAARERRLGSSPAA